MILLDSQIQFAAEYLNPLSRDEKVQLPAGYKAKFEKWLSLSGIKTYQFTPEEQAKMFAYFLEKELKVDTLAAIDKLKAPKEEKAKLRSLAGRGQVLLASRNEGKTFDRLITLEDLGAVKAQDFMLLTPILQSIPQDLAEVIHQQTAFHVISNYAQHGIIAEYEGMDGDDILVSIAHPKFGQDTIRVNTAGDISKPLKYTSEKTGREFFESQAPEVYGTAQADPNLQALSKEELVSLHLAGQGIDPTQYVGAFAATASAVQAVNFANHANQLAMLNAINQEQSQKLLGERAIGLSLAQVIAAKARMARQRRGAEDRGKRVQERKEKFAQAETEMARANRAKEEQAAEKRKKQKKQKTKKMAVASAAAGGAVISGGGLFMFINNLSINF